MDAGFSRFFCLVFLAASTVASFVVAPDAAQAQRDRGAPPGDFDYYVLALSWSPTYCDGQAERDGYRDRYDRGGGYDRYRFFNDRRGYSRRRGDSDEQCSGVRSYAFVLHGLWPQYERRGWPEMCESEKRPWVPEEIIDRMTDVMPSRQLVIQEYKKHGVCSGLEPREYFNKAREAYRSIRIPQEYQDLSKPLSVSPDDVRRAFLDANPQLSPDMIQVVCSRRLLRELRVCFSKDLTPRSCSPREQSRRLCSYDTVTMPPVRGAGVGARGGPSQQGRPSRQGGESQEGDRL